MGGDRQGICLPAYGLRVLEKFARIDNGVRSTPRMPKFNKRCSPNDRHSVPIVCMVADQLPHRLIALEPDTDLDLDAALDQPLC